MEIKVRKCWYVFWYVDGQFKECYKCFDDKDKAQNFLQRMLDDEDIYKVRFEECSTYFK